ncbi:alpha/beta fold hydrolase [Roseitranquillus sediminis]|uniref:alpha/beta fold hydrolase n=1 Tax=Roseitranquillus sediminis TaxID=2809051 RepID=UPI002221CC8F|nr:alpha/beta hydrolase [Roseitranquillus sediminis]
MSVLERNRVTVTGQGARVLLFAHGFGCDQAMWRQVAPEFETDHRVVLYDLTGAGGSDLGAYDFARYRSLDGHAEDMIEICEALGLERVVAVGHSVSAIIAALAAIRRPDLFDRLVLLSPSPCFMNDGAYRGGFERAELEGLIAFMDENYLGWSTQLAPTIAGQDGDEPGAVELTQSFCRTDPRIAQHFGRVTFLSDRRADMPNLEVPALIVQCADDALAPVGVGEWMHASIPRSALEVVDVSGHCPHLTAPDVTVRAIRAYLGRDGS